LPALRLLDLSSNPIPVSFRADLALAAADRPLLELFFASPILRAIHPPIVRSVEPTPAGDMVRLTIPKSDPEVIDGLAGCLALGTLTALTVRDTFISPETASKLAAGLSPGRWQELDLTGCELGENPAAVLGRFCAGHRLARLTVAGIG